MESGVDRSEMLRQNGNWEWLTRSGGEMHSLSDKNKYVGFLFMKMSQEYFSLGREGIRKVTLEHLQTLAKHADKLTHIVSSGLDARYDQVTMIEADSLEEIHNAAVDFRMGAKAAYIDIVDVVIGMKAPRRNIAARTEKLAETASAE